MILDGLQSSPVKEGTTVPKSLLLVSISMTANAPLPAESRWQPLPTFISRVPSVKRELVGVGEGAEGGEGVKDVERLHLAGCSIARRKALTFVA
jgi:hypothetical protein